MEEIYELKHNIIWHNTNDFEPTSEFITRSIDYGHPLIVAYGQGDLGHIIVIKRYTDTGEYVVNDSYRNTSERPYPEGYTDDNLDRIPDRVIVNDSLETLLKLVRIIT